LDLADVPVFFEVLLIMALRKSLALLPAVVCSPEGCNPPLVFFGSSYLLLASTLNPISSSWSVCRNYILLCISFWYGHPCWLSPTVKEDHKPLPDQLHSKLIKSTGSGVWALSSVAFFLSFATLNLNL